MSVELFGHVFRLAFLPELIIAYVLALPIAFDRERSQRSAGLRTFPIVSLASCGFLLLARQALGDDADALARVLYGLMTGIGFIGGGAIIKQAGSTHGTATAASIWCTGAIGAAVAFDRFGIALALALFTFLTLLVFKPIKDLMHDDSSDGASGRTRQKDADSSAGD
jgi:putative Mg2+ transporter-C (MgtC) family protein